MRHLTLPFGGVWCFQVYQGLVLAGVYFPVGGGHRNVALIQQDKDATNKRDYQIYFQLFIFSLLLQVSKIVLSLLHN